MSKYFKQRVSRHGDMVSIGGIQEKGFSDDEANFISDSAFPHLHQGFFIHSTAAARPSSKGMAQLKFRKSHNHQPFHKDNEEKS